MPRPGYIELSLLRSSQLNLSHTGKGADSILPNTVEISSFKTEHIPAVVALLNRCLTADSISLETFEQKVLLDQNYDARGTLVALEGERVVGFALGLVRKFKLEDGAPDFDTSWITLIGVDEDRRRRGIGAKLVGALESYFCLSKCAVTQVSPYAPNYFFPGVDVNAYSGALGFFKALGYSELYRPLSMDANLVHLQTPDWVREKETALEGSVSFEEFRAELILPVLEFMKNEFPGDWQRYVRDTMIRISSGQYRADNLWAALENGRVIGYAQHDNAGRFGPFGVASSERGRGIGMVLLFKTLNAMRAKGLHNAWFLWTDDRVAELYALAGFRESRRFAVLAKRTV